MADENSDCGSNLQSALSRPFIIFNLQADYADILQYPIQE